MEVFQGELNDRRSRAKKLHASIASADRAAGGLLAQLNSCESSYLVSGAMPLGEIELVFRLAAGRSPIVGDE